MNGAGELKDLYFEDFWVFFLLEGTISPRGTDLGSIPTGQGKWT